MNRVLYSLSTLALLVVVPVTASTRVELEPTLDRAVDSALVRLQQEPADPLALPESVAAPAEEEIVDRRRTAIARSVLTLRAQTDTTLAVLEGDVLTMLSLARNHRHLGMRQRALRLYDLTVLADRDHEYTREILRERMVCAIELGDSTSVLAQATEIADRPDAATYGESLAEALTFLCATPRLGVAVQRLVDRVQAVSGLDHPLCLVRVAQARQMLGQHTVAHSIYRGLSLRGRDLDAHPLAMVLMGLADSALASGDRALARSLYERYRDHDAGRLSAWSTYQLGNLAASTGDFDRAVALLRSICEREERTPWQESACTRLAQVRQLLEIEAELRPYGRDLANSGADR